jgi:hypothetical protein
MNYQLSRHAIDVITSRNIDTKWIDDTFQNYSRIDKIAENEIHFFKSIKENENRCLKVVFNPLTKIVITCYFDRNMRKRGCR